MCGDNTPEERVGEGEERESRIRGQGGKEGLWSAQDLQCLTRPVWRKCSQNVLNFNFRNIELITKTFAMELVID